MLYLYNYILAVLLIMPQFIYHIYSYLRWQRKQGNLVTSPVFKCRLTAHTHSSNGIYVCLPPLNIADVQLKCDKSHYCINFIKSNNKLSNEVKKRLRNFIKRRILQILRVPCRLHNPLVGTWDMCTAFQ